MWYMLFFGVSFNGMDSGRCVPVPLGWLSVLWDVPEENRGLLAQS